VPIAKSAWSCLFSSIASRKPERLPTALSALPPLAAKRSRKGESRSAFGASEASESRPTRRFRLGPQVRQVEKRPRLVVGEPRDVDRHELRALAVRRRLEPDDEVEARVVHQRDDALVDLAMGDESGFGGALRAARCSRSAWR
jgi:hypothetical protein